MNKIKHVSYFFRVVLQIIFFMLPVVLVLSWIYAPNELVFFAGIVKLDALPVAYQGLHAYNSQRILEKSILHVLSPDEKILGCLISSIPKMVQMFIIYYLIQLFNLYEKGEIFSINHVKYIRNIAYALLLTQLVEPLYQSLMGLILTINNPPHHRYIAISFDQTNIGILLTALLLILISWIMAEGYKLREEQQLIV